MSVREVRSRIRRLWLLTETMPVRLLYAGAAIALQTIEDTARSLSQMILGQGAAAGLSFALMTLSLLCLGVAISPRLLTALARRVPRALSRATRWVMLRILLALAIAGMALLVCSGAACFRPQVYSNDGALLDQHAATRLLQGENPYQPDGLAAVRAVHQPAQYLTPLQQGKFAHHPAYPSPAEMSSVLAQEPPGSHARAPEFETRVSYPALAFLALVPLVWAGATTLPFYLSCVVALAVVGVYAARREWRWWVALLFLADLPVLNEALDGNVDVLCVLLLLLAWLHGQRWWASAASMGLALATKQTAWLYLPFYLIYVRQRFGNQDVARRLGIASAIVLALNLPFIVADGGAWVAGVLAPVRDPMYPLGAGLIALSNAQLAPLLSRGAYALLEGLALVRALAVYWRRARARPEAAMLLATIPLFFAWRSLPSYFAFCALLTIILLASGAVGPRALRAPDEQNGQRAASGDADPMCDARGLTTAKRRPIVATKVAESACRLPRASPLPGEMEFRYPRRRPMRSTPIAPRVVRDAFLQTWLPWRQVGLLALALLLALGPVVAFIATPTAHADAPHIDVMSFQRAVDPSGARAVADAINTAEHDGATLLVITVDTPGGDLDSLNKIVQAELAATIPIATYVSPQAAQAASAGSFVTLAAPIAAMAPSTRIGAASPVDAAGNDLPSTLKSKVEQDLEALMRSIQTDYHRSVAPAEAMISNATAYTDGEAMSQGIISLQADSLSALLGQLDGYSGIYASGDSFTVQTAGLAVETLQPSVASTIETFLFDPTVLFILFIVAAICIYLELAHPGATVPGVVGAIALVVFLIGAVGINPNWGGLALMFLAILLLAVDTRAPTHGVLTVGALISLVVGAIIFFDTGSNVGAATVNPAVIAGVTVGVGLVALLVLRYSVGAQMRRVTTGKESYIGQVVTVIEPLAPTGRVNLLGENWSAKLAPKATGAGALPVGARARIVRVEGLMLLVEPVPVASATPDK